MIEIACGKRLRDFDLDIAFRVDAGECLALVGPTGCGKTTTLRLIAGLDRPDWGSIRTDREVLVDAGTGVFVPPQRRGLGMVFQDLALFPHLSVLRNAAYGARARGRSKDEAEVLARRALDLVQMSEYEHVHPPHLSGGQRQRVALARALVSEPRALLLDEPLSALDAATRRQIREQLRRLLDSLGIPTILVTHDVVDALTLGTRVCVMNQGRVEQLGRRTELISRPKSAFVAEFLGVNLIAGRASAGEDGMTLVECSGVQFRGIAEAPDSEPDGLSDTEAEPAGSGGAHVTFSPGDVRLLREAPPGGRGNVIRGRVTSITHLGERARVTVEDSVAVVAEVPHEVLGQLDAHVGETLYAVVDPRLVHVYA